MNGTSEKACECRTAVPDLFRKGDRARTRQSRFACSDRCHRFHSKRRGKIKHVLHARMESCAHYEWLFSRSACRSASRRKIQGRRPANPAWKENTFALFSTGNKKPSCHRFHPEE